MKLNKNILLNTIAIILIIFFILRTTYLLQEEILVHIFWLCNHAMLIMAIAILFRNSFWLLAEISIASVGVIIWILDLISKLLFNFHIFGSTAYLFPIVSEGFFFVTSMVHLLSIPLGIWALFLIGKKSPSAWKGSLIHAIILFPFILYFKDYNLNCFLKPCISQIPNFTLYPLIFILIYFILFVIPINKGLNKLLKKSKINQ